MWADDMGDVSIDTVILRIDMAYLVTLPPHSVPPLAMSSTTLCTGARHIIHCICQVYRYWPMNPPRMRLRF
jgi:hypothetical protein